MTNKKIFTFLLILVLASFLRLYQLTKVPPSLYWEEVAVGYDAYSLLQTGRDHHGASWPVIAIKSFGDWKPTGYFYALLPSLATFGLTDFAVRLPNAIAGIFIVIGISVLARRWGISALWSLLVAAVSPWGLQFSRSMWEANFATALIVWGIIGVMYTHHFWYKKTAYWPLIAVLTSFLFIFAGYTYHAARFIAPMLCFASAVFVYLTEARSKKSVTPLVLVVGLSALFFIPLFVKASDPELSHRLQETSIFSDSSIIERSNFLREQNNFSFASRVLYHRYVLFGQKIIENALSHFSFSYLFLTGDENIRHSTHFVGQLYIFESLLLLVGSAALWKKNRKVSVFLLFWLGCALLPASITKAVPHALRTLPAFPVFILLITVGISTFLKNIPRSVPTWVATSVILAVYLVCSAQYLRYYFKVYPINSGEEWQYGYAEMISKVVALEKSYPNALVYITRFEGRPAMYYWFYTKTDPVRVQQEAKTAVMDQGEFLTFENKRFFREVPKLTQDSILVAAPEEVQSVESQNQDYSFTKIDTVSSLTGTIVWQLLVAEKK